MLNEDATHTIKQEMKLDEIFNKVNKNQNAYSNLNYDIINDDVLRPKTNTRKQSWNKIYVDYTRLA